MSFLSYHLFSTSQESLSTYLKKALKTPKREIEEALLTLLDKKIIIFKKATYRWDSDQYKLSEEWMMKTICWTLTFHPEWIEAFKTAIGKRESSNPTRVKLIQLCDSALQGKESNLLLERSLCDYYSNLAAPLLNDPNFELFNQLLPKSILLDIIPSQIELHINNDFGTNIEKLINIVAHKNVEGLEWDNLLNHLQLAHYLQTGRESVLLRPRKETGYSYLLQAIRKIEEGDYTIANALFLIDERERKASSLNRFGWSQYPIVNLLRCIAYYKEHSSISLTFDFNKSSTLGAEILADVIESDEPEDYTGKIVTLLRSVESTGWVNQKIAKMLCQWLNISTKQIKKEDPRLVFNPDQIQYYSYGVQLADRLLQTITVKAEWEKAIESILNNEEKLKKQSNETPSSDNRDTRLAYFYYGGYSGIEVREQSRLKSGNWSSGKKVSDANFIYFSSSLYDDIDNKVKKLYERHRYDRVSIHELLPLLEGSDKLFIGNRAPYVCCRVQEEKPFLTTKIDAEQITISTNVPEDQLRDNDEDHVLFSFIETTPNITRSVKANQVQRTGIVSYYRIPVRVRTYISALVRVGHFPLAAESQIKQLFEQIKGLVEIHSEMIEGGSNLPQIEADCHIILQALPINGDYQVKAIVRPLAEGKQIVLPGRGENCIYDQMTDGTRYQIVRDKKKERQNIKPLLDFLDQAEIEEDSPFVWRLDPYSLLDLLEWIPEQGDDFILEWPEGQQIRLSQTNPTNWNISLKEKAGWFEVEGEVPIDEKTVLSIGQLLQLLEDGHGRFIQLQDGQYLRLTDSLRRQLSRLDSVAQTHRGKTRISPLGAGLIADYLDGEISIQRPEKINKMRQLIHASKELQANIPDELNASLRDYQADGFRWMDRLASWGAGACLADDMGLGKTIQTITFLLHKKKEGASMVVAPASVVANWKKEIARFAPSLRTTVLNELSGDERREAVEQAQEGDAILTTYGLLISEEESLTAKNWNVICLDEAHSIKNASTKSSGVCMQLQAKNRIILTGTPIQNHLGELWNLFQFINPGLLGSYEQFTQKYINPIEGGHDKDRQQQLKRIIQPFMLRRTKQEVVSELPDKQEITLPIQLSTEEMSIYELIRLEAKSQLEEDAAVGGSASVNALAMITKLRMASCAASLAQKKWTGPSSKLDAFSELVSEICSTGNHVLVFSQFTSFLEMAKGQLEKEGITDFLYLDGSTTLKKRNQMVEQFQSGKATIFLISLKAGGLGLNLTNANYVIHLDPWWNPAIEQQATDRAYRIGQQQKVTVYHLISEHTIEEKIVRLHQTKRDLADSLLEGTDMSHKLTASDLLAMLEERG